MRALVFTAPGEMELQEVAEPRPEPGEIVVEVRAAGICGSELHGFRSAGFRVPPLVMGHEFAGSTADGRRVVVNPLLSCGVCDMCGRMLPQLCRRRELLGVHRGGGFAPRVAVPAGALLDIPADLSWEVAAMVEPLANAVHALRMVDLERSERLAVVGAGSIGLACLLVALHNGAADVTVVDTSPERLALAERLGASTCASRLEGEYDAIVDAVGAGATRRATVERLRPGGTTVWIGLAHGEASFDGNELVRFEKKITGSFAYTPAEFADALAVAGRLDLDWSTSVGMEESRSTFMALADGASHPVKAIIVS